MVFLRRKLMYSPPFNFSRLFFVQHYLWDIPRTRLSSRECVVDLGAPRGFDRRFLPLSLPLLIPRPPCPILFVDSPPPSLPLMPAGPLFDLPFPPPFPTPNAVFLRGQTLCLFFRVGFHCTSVHPPFPRFPFCFFFFFRIVLFGPPTQPPFR